MSKLYTQIQDARLNARKASDSFKVQVLSTLIGEVQGAWSKLKVDERGDAPNDALVGKIVTSFVNNLTELLKHKPSPEGEAELSILKTYLPTLLTNEQLGVIVAERLTEYTEDKGNKIKFVMDYLKTEYPNAYDGKAVRQFIS